MFKKFFLERNVFIFEARKFLLATSMTKLYSIIFFSSIYFGNANAQAGYARLMLNDNPYVVMQGSVFLVIQNSDANAITCMVGGVPASSYTNGRIVTVNDNSNSKVQWAAKAVTNDYVIPFWYSTTTAIPFRFNKTTTGTETSAGSGYFTASTYYTSANTTWPGASYLCGAAAEDDVMDRFWVIDVLGYSANPTATMDFYYREIAGTVEGEVPSGFVESDYLAQRWNSALVPACKWETPQVGTNFAASNYVEVTGVSNFSPWTLVNKAKPLPIELLFLSGECKNKKVVLHWETATEINNAFFTIERSTDGETYEAIGTKQGAGNSSTVVHYDFTDENSANGIAYYRFKQTDFDGNYSYSPTIAIQNCNDKTNETITIYIGGNNEIVVKTNSTSKRKYDVHFYDSIGKVVHSEILNVAEGSNVQLLNHRKLATGIYLITLQNEEEAITQKLFMH